MTINDIIEKLEGDLKGKNPNIVYVFDQPERYIGKLLKWIKSNLEEKAT